MAGGVLAQMAQRVGPGALQAVKALGPVIAANPDALRQARELLDRAVAAQRSRTSDERLRRSVALLRQEALRLEAEAVEPGDKERAAEWLRRTDGLAGAIALLEVHRGAQRRADVARLRRRVDVLFAEVFTAAVEDEV